jgi:hypothetical protein
MRVRSGEEDADDGVKEERGGQRRNVEAFGRSVDLAVVAGRWAFLVQMLQRLG